MAQVPVPMGPGVCGLEKTPDRPVRTSWLLPCVVLSIMKPTLPGPLGVAPV
jgi:hypothetical protein